jgi:hypothetical protein
MLSIDQDKGDWLLGQNPSIVSREARKRRRRSMMNNIAIRLLVLLHYSGASARLRGNNGIVTFRIQLWIW